MGKKYVKFMTVKAYDNTTGKILKVARDKKFGKDWHTLVLSSSKKHQFFDHERNLREIKAVWTNGIQIVEKGGWVFYYAKGPSIYQNM